MSKKAGPGHNSGDDHPAQGNIAADRLRSIVERVERLNEERKALAEDIKDIFTEAKSAGFDVKVVRQLIKIRQKSPEEVEEEEILLDVYRAALGMLGRDGLSGAARKRLSGEDDPPPPGSTSADEAAPAPEDDESGDEPVEGTEPADEPASLSVEDAREQGAAAAAAGEKVTTNPWPFGDPRRAAWDEGWCASTGSDGMEIPDAWRRRKKPDPAPEASP